MSAAQRIHSRCLVLNSTGPFPIKINAVDADHTVWTNQVPQHNRETLGLYEVQPEQ